MNGQNVHQRGGLPRAPYDVPRWGRPPPGMRMRGDRDVYYADQDRRFEEIATEDEDAYLQYHSRAPYEDGRFQSDELLFDGIDVHEQNYMGSRRSHGHYYEDSEYSETENYYREEHDYPLRREHSRQSMIIDSDEELVARALDRIARARASGMANVKLSQAEIDALERRERSKPLPKPVPTQKALPATKKTPVRKAIETSKKKRSDSPKARPVESRVRNRSDASTGSGREDDLVSYPIPADLDHGHFHRSAYPSDSRSSYQGSPLRPAGSRSNSYSNIRQPTGPPMYAPYYQNQRIVSNPENFHHRPDPYAHRSRADSDQRSVHSSRSRSNSHLRTMPGDQVPYPSHSGRPTRFDPNDPRFGSPSSRRVVSGPPYDAPLSRRGSDELFLNVPHEPEVMNYRLSSKPPSRSSSESDGSLYEAPITVDVTEKPGSKSGYAVKTKSGATTTSSKSKSNTKAAVRRR